MRTLQEWADLARASTKNVTSENIVFIAMECFEAERNGGIAAVWHVSALVHKTKCVCAHCNPGVRFV